MQETVKKRAWVKNAAIVFLAVMLILTFFSNTIMNRTLPEVATQYVVSETIDSKVRVSGTVTAKENYDVILDQSRKVESVAVTVGQSVAVGDVLFTLEAGDSEDLKTARETLHDLEVAYQRSLINASSADYSQEDRSIQKARTELENAQAALDRLTPVSQTEMDNAQAAADAAQADVDTWTQSVKDAQTGVDRTSDGSGGNGSLSSSYDTAIANAKARRIEADNTRKAAHLAYDTQYSALEGDISTPDTVRGQIAEDYNAAHPAPEKQFAELDEAQQALLFSQNLDYYFGMLAKALPAGDPRRIAYEKITEAESAYASALTAEKNAEAAKADALESLYSGYTSATYYNGKSHSEYLKALEAAQTGLAAAEKTLAVSQKTLTGLTGQKTAYEAAAKTVSDCENSLSDLLFNLSQTQKADNKAMQLEALERQEAQRDIQRQKELVEELEGGDTGATQVLAKVNGVVQSLSVSAGHTAAANETVMTIEVPDLGYTLTASLTNDQARLLHAGDTASINSYYWGSETIATVASIKTDPKNPQSGKQVTFDITGDVSVGSTLSFSIGARNATYDLVVPNSALRTDSKGSFVLMITAKNSPLGNRYYATRVNVEVLAQDELNAAVSGGISAYDSVITTANANAPVANGDMVRLADNNT